MIASASVRQVSRKVAIGGGTAAAISAIASSLIGPGPLGMAETRPIAPAPYRIARCASARLRMQQILTRGITRMLKLPVMQRALVATAAWIDDLPANPRGLSSGNVQAYTARSRRRQDTRPARR